jgi:transcriptional regulator with PAS, ATPase and Fis domain
MNVIRHALEIRNLKSENRMLHKTMITDQIENPEAYAKIITASRKMQVIFQYIDSIAITSQPVLITGETGVGKELIAEAVHLASKRKGKLVTLNVAGLDDATFSDTLFGHKPGAYTDAKQKRSGLIDSASDGTIFLDEIGDLKESSQVKLLRLIQEKEYYPLGSDAPAKSNVRIIAATNHNLKKMIEDGNFRRDLYYRLNLHHIHIPPLRERPEDIQLLADNLISEACFELKINCPKVTQEFFDSLKRYAFPGNVRELQAVIYESLTRAADGAISLDFIKSLQGGEKGGRAGNKSIVDDIPLATLEETEELMIDKALDVADGNLSQAAKALGVSRSTLYRKLNKK